MTHTQVTLARCPECGHDVDTHNGYYADHFLSGNRKLVKPDTWQPPAGGSWHLCGGGNRNVAPLPEVTFPDHGDVFGGSWWTVGNGAQLRLQGNDESRWIEPTPDDLLAMLRAVGHGIYAPHPDRPELHIPCTCCDDRSDGRGFAQHAAGCAYSIAETALRERGIGIEARP